MDDLWKTDDEKVDKRTIGLDQCRNLTAVLLDRGAFEVDGLST